MLKVGNVTLPTNAFLAPVAGYFDLAYRLVVRSVEGHNGHGAVGLTCTDLLCPQAMLSENEKTLWLAATSPKDQPVCMQLYGADSDIMAEAAKWAEAHGATTIDINMGCPVDKVTKKNGGSKLLCDPLGTIDMARKVVNAVNVPVTAKIRLGWDDDALIHKTLPSQLADVGIAMVTVHGRTTEMKFRGEARLDGIAETVEGVKRHHDIPVIGNGDIKCAEDAKRMMDVTGCDGVMVARGAMGQPWIFREIVHYLETGEHAPPYPRVERMRCVIEHFENMMDMREERIAVNTIRCRMSKYSPHLQPWPNLKRDVQYIKTASEMRDFLAKGMQRIREEEAAGLAI
ncbi:tRNA dihydrouridine synthase DusB [Poriferisphaera sp. WC338]|uniref:tRNA dihydrouridine synthase DusB n=1 Tax=Poriferisphaera sp. WC338 TaxID=3425129 RepID=UPI003D8141BF